MAGTPAHDFLAPRIAALLAEARAQGIAREAAVAVMIDIVTSSAYDTALPDPREDTTPGAANYPAQIDQEAAIEMGPAEARTPGPEVPIIRGY